MNIDPSNLIKDIKNGQVRWLENEFEDQHIDQQLYEAVVFTLDEGRSHE